MNSLGTSEAAAYIANPITDEVHCKSEIVIFLRRVHRLKSHLDHQEATPEQLEDTSSLVRDTDSDITMNPTALYMSILFMRNKNDST